MTTGPRNTPHPIILHVDAQGNPVRLAEASAIYATNVSAVTVSAVTVCATNWVGLNFANAGIPAGDNGSIQFKKSGAEFDGRSEFIYDPNTFTLLTNNVNVADLTRSDEIISNSVSATNSSAVNLYATTISATTISATTVCATNYNQALDALSFQNLDNRYLNSSGDSVTGSIYIQNLSATTISATAYLNLPSSVATWNASAIQGLSVTSTSPFPGESLVWLGTAWGPSAVGGVGGGNPGEPNLSIQFKNGSFFSGTDNVKYNQSINGIESVNLSSTNLSSTNIRSNIVCATIVSATTYLNISSADAIWNANRIQGTAFTKGSLVQDDFITYESPTGWKNTTFANVANILSPTLHTETWNASGIRGVPVTSTAPGSNNVLIYNGSVWIPSGSISLNNIIATNLGGTDIVGSRANITSISATTVSATTYRNLPTSSLSGLADVSATSVSAGQALIYSSSVNRWAPGYRIYQNNSQPNASVGANGDIYFQILDSTGTALSSLIDTSIITPTNGQSLIWSSGISKWIPGAAVESVGNASAIRGEQIIDKEAAPVGSNALGALSYIYSINKYQTVPLNSSSVNGTRNIESYNVGDPSQGAFVASYLTSASQYFQLNPYWNSPNLAAILQYAYGVTGTYTYPDIPQDKDVLVFTENLYGKALDLTGPIGFTPENKAWTWERLSLGGNYLLDVDTSTATINQVLSFNGSKWANSSNITQVSATGFYITSGELSSVKLTKYYESKTQPAIAGSSLILNLNNSQTFDVTLNSNVTSITIQNVVNANETTQGFTLAITYDATARTISWPVEIKWPGGTAPVLTNTNNKIDIFSFVTLNKGSSWLGFISGQNYSA